MLITDGGVALNGAPLYLEGSCTTTCSVYGGYYNSTIGPETMTATLSNVNLNQIVAGPGVNTPVQIVRYGSGNGGVGTYQLSSAANGNVGSSGSPVAFTLASIVGGGSPSPRPALTISDLGAGTMYRGHQLSVREPDRFDPAHRNLQHSEPRRNAVGDPGAAFAYRRRSGDLRLLMGEPLLSDDRRRGLVGQDRQRAARRLLGVGQGRKRNRLCDDDQFRHCRRANGDRGRRQPRRLFWHYCWFAEHHHQRHSIGR